jgi:hypothetical protein
VTNKGCLLEIYNIKYVSRNEGLPSKRREIHVPYRLAAWDCLLNEEEKMTFKSNKETKEIFFKKE